MHARPIESKHNEKDFDHIVPKLKSPGEIFDYYAAFSRMEALRSFFENKDYRAAIETFIDIKVYDNPVILQQAYYYIGVCFARMNEVNSAELYMRKALYTTNEAERSGDISSSDLDGQGHLIPKNQVIKELEAYQFLIRTKAAADVEIESPSQPLLTQLERTADIAPSML